MKLHLICSKDELRQAMNHVFIEGGQAVATNGHVIGVIEELPFDLPDGYVHREDWKVLSTFKPGESIVEMEHEGMIKFYHQSRWHYFKFITIDKWMEDFGQLSGFPSWESLIPKNEPVKIQTIGINSKLLKDLSDAIGTTRIKLEFNGELKGVKVLSLDPDMRSYGIIMPIFSSH